MWTATVPPLKYTMGTQMCRTCSHVNAALVQGMPVMTMMMMINLAQAIEDYITYQWLI